MSCIDPVISFFSMLAAIASAIAAWKSAASAKTANTLAREALTKRVQSEIFMKVLSELARIYRLMFDFCNGNPNDTDFTKVFDGNAPIELLPLLKELEALSPKFRESFNGSTSLIDFLKRMSSKGYSSSKRRLNPYAKHD